jgi:streptomycin 6-kinase
VLFIEYDVMQDGEIELVALINAVEKNDDDADGSAWMAWRAAEFDDNGVGCVGVREDQLALMEATEDADQLRAVVEHIILADHANKEEGPP